MQAVFASNRSSRVDSGLASALTAAAGVYDDKRSVAVSEASRLAAAPQLQDALRSRDATALRAAIGGSDALGIQAAVVDPTGQVLTGQTATGSSFQARSNIQDATGKPLGSVVIGFSLDAAVAARLAQSAPAEVVVGFLEGNRAVTSDGSEPADVPPTRGTRSAGGRIAGVRYRVASIPLDGATPATSAIALYPQARLDREAGDVRTKVAIVVGVALLGILLLAELLVRSITGQIGIFARRAREVGEGRFGGDLPVHGRDEFAQFATTFNRMAAELEQRIAELEAERARVREALARFGQALESTHDVSALLQIVVESAMGAVDARGGRVLIVDEQSGALIEHLRLGSAIEASATTLPPTVVARDGVEGLALQTMRPALGHDPVPVIAVPLQSTQAVVGLLTLIDPVRGAFDEGDCGTLQALASQGAIAIDNARMHRLITKQASTDGLTGLANHREFQDQLRREVERAQRFGLPLALILLDLDDFKLVNDRFGHLAGDSVLRSVAGVLRGTIREIDCAARYGGEEFAVILPGTNREGAARLAERVRVTLAERPTALVEARNVAVTASFGVASLPHDGSTQVELVAAADEALYRAKDSGKNRVAIGGAARETL